MSLLVQLGKKIQTIREKRGLTQEQLEEKTEVNAKYISALERGQQNVTIKLYAWGQKNSFSSFSTTFTARSYQSIGK